MGNATRDNAHWTTPCRPGHSCARPAIGAVLVVDDLVPAAARFLRRSGRPGLGEDLPVGEVLAGVLAAPLSDGVGLLGNTGAEDVRTARRPRSRAGSLRRSSRRPRRR